MNQYTIKLQTIYCCIYTQNLLYHKKIFKKNLKNNYFYIKIWVTQFFKKMKLIKKLAIFTLVVLLVACDDLDGMCYNETDYGNSGDYDTINVNPGNSICSYNSTAKISSLEQSATVVECLGRTSMGSVIPNSGLNSGQLGNLAGDKNEITCTQLAGEVYNGDYAEDRFKNAESMSIQDQQLIVTSIFNACVEKCVNECEAKSLGSEDQWVKANIKTGDNYLGIRLSGSTLLNIRATGQVNLTGSVDSNSIGFNKIGIEDVFRGVNTYLKNGDSAEVILKINKNEVMDSASLADFKSRTYFGLKTYNPNLSSDALATSKHYYQEPDYSTVYCDYGEQSANCEFDYSRVINNSQGDAALSSFISNLNTYYNDYYSTMLFSSLNNEQYSKYVSNSFNNILYDPTTSSLKTSDEEIFIVDLNKTTAISKKGVPEGYVWNDSNESYSFNAKGPFKLAIKYLGAENNLNCKYTISYEDYVLTKVDNVYKGEKVPIVLNISYNNTANKSNSGRYTWKTVKYVIGEEDKNSVKIENIFNRYSTVDNPLDLKITIRNVSDTGSRETCSKGLAIKLLTMKDHKIKRSGLLFLAMPGINHNGVGIKYKLINQNSLYVNSNSLSLANKLQDFFETYSVSPLENNLNSSNDDDSMVYREIKVATNNEIESMRKGVIESSVIGTLNNLIANDKVIYVRKDQQIRFDYSNWINIDGKENIEIKTSNLSSNSSLNGNSSTPTTYFGTGLNIFIKENPSYICYGAAEESVDMEVKCGESGGTYSDFEYVDENNQTKQALVCYIEKEQCFAKEDFVTAFKRIYPEGGAPDSSVLSKYNYKKKSLTTFAAEVITEYYKYEDLVSFYPNSDDPDEIAEKNSAIKNSGLSSTRYEAYYDIISELYNQIKLCYDSLNKDNKYSYYAGVPDKDGYEDYKKSMGSISYGNDEVIQIKRTNGLMLTVLDENGAIVLPNFTLASDDKKLFYDAIVKRISELLQINKVVDTDNQTTSYTSNFYYYENICSRTESGNCRGENIVQCYDLSSYNGSTRMLLDRIRNNNTANETEILSHGKLTAIDRAFGAKKINEYNGSSGLIKNLTNVYDGTDGEHYYSFQYKNNTTSGGLNFYSIFVINPINYNGNYETAIKNFMKPQIRTYAKTEDFTIKLSSKSTSGYQNGDRMAVMLGRNDKTYYSSNKEGEKDLAYYKNANRNVSASESTTNDEQRIFNLVSYNANGNLDDKSRCKFDLDGNLIKNYSNNSAGFSFKENELAANFLSLGGEDNYKNIFFRIVDVDDSVTNNSGSYKVIINTFSSDESQIITYFKDFFNKILTFIDGSYFELQVANDNFVSCTSRDRSYCYIYNEENVSENGNSCSEDDNNPNCFENCHPVGSNGNTHPICKKVYDGKGFVKNIFEMFINDPLYQFIAKIALVLAITLYGFSYFFGLSNFTQSEISKRILRYIFIYTIISPSGWNFFNEFIIRFFKDGIDSLLFLIASAFDTDVNSALYAASISGSYGDKSMLFSSTFKNLELIFSEAIFNKMLGLAFSGWFGFIYLYLVLSAVLNYMVGSFTAIILYLSAQLYMSLVFCFFPLVLLFMFFEKTKKTFDNWLGLLIGFAGQQLFLITTLSFFNLLVLTYIKMTFTYRVCLLPILNLNLGGIPLAAIMFWKIPSTSFSNSISIMDENLPNFYTIISFYIITVLMGKFITGMVEVGKTIFGGLGIGEGVAQVFTDGISKASSLAKDSMKDLGSTFGKGMANRFLGGQAIEDYKEKQDKERKERRERRENYFSKHEDSTKSKLDKYKNGEQFAKDRKKAVKEEQDKRLNELKSSKKYNNASDKRKAKMEDEVKKKAEKDATTKLLREKEREVSYNQGVKQIIESGKFSKELDDISMKERGKEFSELSKDEQKEMAGRYGVRQGLLSEWKPKEGESKPKPPKKDNNDKKESINLGQSSNGSSPDKISRSSNEENSDKANSNKPTNYDNDSDSTSQNREPNEKEEREGIDAYAFNEKKDEDKEEING